MPEEPKQPVATESAPFDLEAVYDAEIAPLMTEIIAICRRHHMPMVASFMYQHHQGEEEIDAYCTTALGGVGDWMPERIQQAVRIIRSPNRTAAFVVTSTRREL